MANDQRTQNPCIVKGSEPSTHPAHSTQDKSTPEKRSEQQQSEKQSSKQSEKQAEKKQAGAVESPTETKTENQSSNSGDDSSNAYNPYNPGNLRAVSLADELRDLEYGLRALKRLSDIAEAEEADDTGEGESIGLEIAAIITLIIYRINLVRLMVESKIDPISIWSTWNDAGFSYWKIKPNNDVIFEEWTTNQKLIHARAVLDEAERKVAEEFAKKRQTHE